MKNLNSFLFLLLVGIYSCADDHISPPSISSDLVLSKHNTSTITTPFDPCISNNLVVCYDQCFDEKLGEDWLCSIKDAVDKYNDLPESININMTLSPCNDLDAHVVPQITFDCEIMDSQNVGETSPEDANGTNHISLNPITPNLIFCEDPCCTFSSIVIHELGHALGFGHTIESNEETPTWIEGTLLDDPESIFGNEGELCNRKCEFSEGDIKALEIQYPIPPICDCPIIQAPKVNITGLCCLPKPKLQNNDCQNYHTYGHVEDGSIVEYNWWISPMTGVTIYNNSHQSSIFIFSFDETVIDGDDFVIGLDAKIDLCDNLYVVKDTQIVEVYNCEDEDGDDDQ